MVKKIFFCRKNIRKSGLYPKDYELKACLITNKHKYKLYRSLDNCYKFGLIIDQKHVYDKIFNSKKDKQRYLDYAYKIAVKRTLVDMMHHGLFNKSDVENIFFYVDDHTTASNGRYMLKDALEQELKSGTYNMDYTAFFPPLFPDMGCVQVKYCDSATTLLVRGADIVANRVYYMARNNFSFSKENNLFVHKLP